DIAVTLTKRRYLGSMAWAAILSEASIILCVCSCQTVNSSRESFGSLRVDSPESVLGAGTSPWVGFTLVNTTSKLISSGMCSPNLEAKVGDKWVVAWYGGVLGCVAR